MQLSDSLTCFVSVHFTISNPTSKSIRNTYILPDFFFADMLGPQPSGREGVGQCYRQTLIWGDKGSEALSVGRAVMALSQQQCQHWLACSVQRNSLTKMSLRLQEKALPSFPIGLVSSLRIFFIFLGFCLDCLPCILLRDETYDWLHQDQKC